MSLRRTDERVLKNVTEDDSQLISDSAVNLEKTIISYATTQNTRIAYRSSRNKMIVAGLQLPVTDINELKNYLLMEMKELKAPATISSRLSAVKAWHVLNREEDPTTSPVISKLLKGYKRFYAAYGHDEKLSEIEDIEEDTQKDPRAGKAKPLEYSCIPSLIEAFEGYQRFKRARDTALLLVGFHSAFRAQELLSIRVDSITYTGNTAEIKVFSKTEKIDPTPRILFTNEFMPPYCPIQALKTWIEVAELKPRDHIFMPINKGDKLTKTKGMSTRSLSKIIQNWMLDSGVEDEESVIKYSSHSLRRGYATSGSEYGVPIEKIARQGGWKNISTVMKYIDDAKSKTENPAEDFYKQHLPVQE